MLIVCGTLGVIALLLFAIGIDRQRNAIGHVLAEVGKALQRTARAPLPTATQAQQQLPAPVPDAPEPPAPHGPVPKNTITWFTSDDYPVSALEKEAQGTVGMVLRIDALGRVTGCDIAQSSGVAGLDETTCRLGLARARFYPARDAGGRTIASTWRRRVAWRMPDETGCAKDPADTCR